MNYQLIVDDSALEQVCDQMAAAPYLALDTEFVRTRTYYPQPGLLQLYDGETLALIDPLLITVWQPFKRLLTAPGQIKLLHAGSEDLELLQTAYGVLPTPFLDTQIMAAFAGLPLSCSFATLVQHYLQVTLDKSETRTDWLARPLSDKQCDYAAADVFYLLPMAEALLQQCQTSGWTEAVRNECELLSQRRQSVLQPEQAYRDIGNAWQLQPRQLACLQLLAAWRLQEARSRDLAINFVVQEVNLWQVARNLPGSMNQLQQLGLSGSEIRFHGKTLLQLVAQAQALPESELPEPLSRIQDHPGYKQAFKAVKGMLQQVAEQSGLSSELLASRRQINQWLQYCWTADQPLPELLSGWRGDLLTDPLQGVMKTLG
ncbi:MAG: ribonuclease D [Enterobacteriaceae bacterium]